MPFPITDEEVFHFAIENRARVISEFCASTDYFRLFEWATQYAKQRGFRQPTLEECGIYYEPDEDTIEDMKSLGIDYGELKAINDHY